jgi:CubicO group peptidase (beta-lactamase class C family)
MRENRERENRMKPLDWNPPLSRRQWLGGAAAIGATAAMPTFPSFAQNPGAWPNLTKLVASYVDSRKVANMVITLGFGEAPPAVIRAGVDTFGRPRASDAQSIYRLYSMTKPVTGMAAMMLIDQGKLGLDQPLHEILPKFKAMQVQKVYDGPITADNLEPAVRPITIRHLLTHTAGIGYGIVQQGPISTAYRERGVVPGMVTRLQSVPAFRGTPVGSLELFADRLAELPLVYQPGTRWSYSMGLDVMGRVIEVVSGMPFDRFLQERFFGPLGTGDLGFRVRDAERLTTSYFIAEGNLLPIDPGASSLYLDPPPFPFGGAGLAGTPLDYDRFLQMVLNHGEYGGKHVLGELAVRVGTSDLLPDTLVADGGYEKGAWGYGAGGRVGKGANFPGVYGWAGAAGTIGFVDFKHGLRAGLYTQYMPSFSYPLLEEFPAAILADLAARGGA